MIYSPLIKLQLINSLQYSDHLRHLVVFDVTHWLCWLVINFRTLFTVKILFNDFHFYEYLPDITSDYFFIIWNIDLIVMCFIFRHQMRNIWINKVLLKLNWGFKIKSCPQIQIIKQTSAFVALEINFTLIRREYFPSQTHHRYWMLNAKC